MENSPGYLESGITGLIAPFVKLQIFIIIVISLCFRFSLNYVSNVNFPLIVTTDLTGITEILV